MKRAFRILPILILVAALALLYRELKHLHWREVAYTMDDIPWQSFFYASILLILNYFAWSAYDWVSLKQLKCYVPYVQIFRTTSVAFPITNIVGYSMLTGFAIRVKKYSPFNVSLGSTAQLILFNVETWWVGFLVLCGSALIHSPLKRGLLGFPPEHTRWVGLALLALAALYLFGCWHGDGRRIQLQRWRIHLPDLRIGTAKILVSLSDNLIVALTMFVFMPEAPDIPFSRFLAYFLSANLVALLSFVPAGWGVLEGVLLYLFRPYASDAHILASMVLFRLVHYLIPVFFAFLTEIGGRAFAHLPSLETNENTGSGLA